MSGLNFQAVIFDMDGVITNTAVVHAEAWKRTFDEYLKSRAEKYGEEFREFTYEDYLEYVDGKPRCKGVQDFLASRGINLPYGSPEDAPEKETICGIGNRKNLFFRKLVEEKGVQIFESTMDMVRELKKRGIKVAVVSSSKNCKFILSKAGVLDDFHVVVDGILSAELNLRGKPNEDIFVDGIVTPLNIQQQQLMSLLAFMEMLQDIAPGVKSTCGLSNVSNGVPTHLRPIINQTYMIMLKRKGMYSFIADAHDDGLLAIARGERPDIEELVYKIMDGEEVDINSLPDNPNHGWKLSDYVKTAKVILGHTLFSDSWLEV